MSKKNTTIFIWVIVVIIVVGLGWWYVAEQNGATTSSQTKTTTTTTTTPANTYGMSQYVDSTYGFSFWYPGTSQVTAAETTDGVDFPGGVAVETLQVGSLGGTSVIVVNSPTSTITDEPANHASPINQTEYFYDSISSKWMIAFPEGSNGPGSGATTTADISKTTISGLFMLPSGKRFNTTIIPLSTTRFLVISDGGGSSFTSQLAKTVAQAGASVDASVQAAALQAEATASVNQ